jgi:hypothetical protein
VRVRVVAVTADGERHARRTPDALAQPGVNLRATERRVRALAATPEAELMTPPGGRLEWRLEYSQDFSRSHVVQEDPEGD